MKKFRLLFLITTVLSLAGCRQEQFPDGQTHWPKVSSQVDSLTNRLEMAIMYNMTPDSVALLLNKMAEATIPYPTPTIRTRLAVFKSRFLRNIKMTDSARQVIASVIVDSGKHPYEFNRIKTERLQCATEEFTPEAYVDWLELKKYYRSIGDTVMWAAANVSLGYFFLSLLNPQKALGYNLEATRLYHAANHDGLVTRLSLNMAQNYMALHDTAACDSIFKRLLDDQSIKEHSPAVREIILRNSYVNHHDTTYLNEALEIVKNNATMRPLTASYDMFQAWEYGARGDNRAALDMLRQAIDHAERYGVENEHHRALIFLNMAEYLERGDDWKGALHYFKAFFDLADNLRTAQAAVDIQRIDTQRQIMENEQGAEQRRARERTLWAFVIAGVVAAAATVVVVFRRRVERMRLRALEVRLENERNNRHLAASALAMKEKDQLLDEMKQNISSMQSQGRIAGEAARELNNMINLHVMGKEEWQAFEVMLEKVSPSFTQGLKRLKPDMTMKYIRLASYIFVGLTNKQIAKLLMIRTESVHQARWRLRAQLGLSSGDSLEDFLMKLGHPDTRDFKK